MTERNRMERQLLLELAKTLRSNGKSIHTVATDLDIHRSSLHRAVKALGQLEAPAPSNPQEDAITNGDEGGDRGSLQRKSTSHKSIGLSSLLPQGMNLGHRKVA